MNGRLGAAQSIANTDVLVYTVPTTAAFATVDINVVNTGDDAATVRISVTNGGDATGITVKDIIEPTRSVQAGGGIIRTCSPLSPGEKVWVKASSTLFSIQVRGFEEPVAV